MINHRRRGIEAKLCCLGMAEGVEEASTPSLLPDLLKNTPSNIARLEDVIEHSKARHKYLAQTTSPSDGGDVRWYFCKTSLAPNGMYLLSVHSKPKKHFFLSLITLYAIYSRLFFNIVLLFYQFNIKLLH